MTGKQVEHVIEEANAGRNGCAPCPVKIDRDLNVGFLCLALYGDPCAWQISFVRAPFIRGSPDSPQASGLFANAQRHT
jgi:hypothetical protein